MKPVVRGVLGAARIALKREIPAMLESELCDVRTIASRDPLRAAEFLNPATSASPLQHGPHARHAASRLEGVLLLFLESVKYPN